MSEPQSNKADFFVGYLRTPESLKRFYKMVVPALLLLGVGVAVAIALSQRSDSNGSWETGMDITLHGVINVNPYPILHVDGDPNRSVLIVVQGKHAANSIAETFSGKAVSISGFAISRGNWLMLEIRGENDITVLPSQEILTDYSYEVYSLGEVELSGEIVDSKCYLGVMNPGDGKVHGACAELCLLGGIPPLLIAKNQQGESVGYLLVLENEVGEIANPLERNYSGISASVHVAPMAGLPLRVSGQLERRGDILFIRARKTEFELL